MERPGCYYLFVFATERPVAVNLRHEEGKAPWRRAAFYGPVAAEGGAWYSLTPTGASFGNQRPFRLECGRHRFALRQRREFRYRLEASVDSGAGEFSSDTVCALKTAIETAAIIVVG